MDSDWFCFRPIGIWLHFINKSNLVSSLIWKPPFCRFEHCTSKIGLILGSMIYLYPLTGVYPTDRSALSPNLRRNGAGASVLQVARTAQPQGPDGSGWRGQRRPRGGRQGTGLPPARRTGQAELHGDALLDWLPLRRGLFGTVSCILYLLDYPWGTVHERIAKWYLVVFYRRVMVMLLFSLAYYRAFAQRDVSLDLVPIFPTRDAPDQLSFGFCRQMTACSRSFWFSPWWW